MNTLTIDFASIAEGDSTYIHVPGSMSYKTFKRIVGRMKREYEIGHPRYKFKLDFSELPLMCRLIRRKTGWDKYNLVYKVGSYQHTECKQASYALCLSRKQKLTGTANFRLGKFVIEKA